MKLQDTAAAVEYIVLENKILDLEARIRADTVALEAAKQLRANVTLRHLNGPSGDLIRDLHNDQTIDHIFRGGRTR